jgi:hypothetical protein
MKNKKGPKKKDRINRSVDTQSIQTRIDRGAQIGKASATSALYQNVAAVKSACDAVVAAGKDLGDADVTATAADQAAATARSARDTKLGTFDTANAICVATVEHHAATPEEIQGAGFVLLIPNNNGLAMLDGVKAAFDAALGVIDIEVLHPAGVTRCLLEFSPDPVTPTSWQRVAGDGLRRKLSGFAPGTYWFRAATVRASAQSAFTTPIAVVVK